MSCTVSVVLPTYNRGDIIGKSIQSVLGQTYEEFEIIVVDDGSTDDTSDIVRTFDDDRITYIEHDENRGAPAARNTGIAAASGEYIAFQDSDDEWLPTKLAKQIRLFQDAPTDVGVVYTGMRRRRADKEVYIPYEGVEQTEGDIHHSLRQQNFIPTQVAVVRQRCFEKVGDLDEKAWPLSDWELWIRISKHFKFRFVDEPLVTGSVRGDSISKNQRALVDARKRIISKHADYFDEPTLARHSFYVGHGSMKLSRPKQARRYLLQAVRLDLRPLYFAALCLSLMPSGIYRQLYHLYKNEHAFG